MIDFGKFPSPGAQTITFSNNVGWLLFTQLFATKKSSFSSKLLSTSDISSSVSTSWFTVKFELYSFELKPQELKMQFIHVKQTIN